MADDRDENYSKGAEKLKTAFADEKAATARGNAITNRTTGIKSGYQTRNNADEAIDTALSVRADAARKKTRRELMYGKDSETD